MKAAAPELARYAELIVRVGANVQPGQIVFVNGLVEHAPLVRAVTESAYAAGARYVEVRYGDQHVRKAFITHGADDDLSVTWPWELERYQALSDGAALIQISGDPEPELLADVDLARLGRARPLEGTKLYVQAVTERLINWTIAAYPTAGQARQVFGDRTSTGCGMPSRAPSGSMPPIRWRRGTSTSRSSAAAASA